jgi:hypothetical protein
MSILLAEVFALSLSRLEVDSGAKTAVHVEGYRVVLVCDFPGTFLSVVSS